MKKIITYNNIELLEFKFLIVVYQITKQGSYYAECFQTTETAYGLSNQWPGLLLSDCVMGIYLPSWQEKYRYRQ